LKFEHILQVYWSKGFFFGGKLFYTNKLLFKTFIKKNLLGLSYKFLKLIEKRLELTTFSMYYSNLFFMVDYSLYSKKFFIKCLNIILSQISNVNSNLSDLKRLNILKKYLIKSYQGYCHAIGKPVRGQRTWSNSWNSIKCNTILKSFITKIKQINSLKNVNNSKKIDYKSVKKRYSSSKKTINNKNINKSSFSKKTWF